MELTINHQTLEVKIHGVVPSQRMIISVGKWETINFGGTHLMDHPILWMITFTDFWGYAIDFWNLLEVKWGTLLEASQ